MEEQQQYIKNKNSLLTGLGSSLFYYKWITKNIGFFLFVAALAVVYIANGHKADKTIRDINTTAKNVEDMKYEYKTLKSEMIFKCREDEVVKGALPLGLQLPTQPPIYIESQTTNKK
jgi:hypothetical protein